MFFGKKRGDKLPDLPPPESSGSMFFPPNKEGIDTHSTNKLPSFPEGPSEDKFSEAAIKDAVSSDKLGEPPSFSASEPSDSNSLAGAVNVQSPAAPTEFQSRFKVSNPEFPTAAQIPMERKSFVMEHEPEEEKEEIDLSVKPSQGSDIFVKIDKFYSAKKTLKEARERLDEIDELIKRIREVKAKEDKELATWEKNLLHVKSRLKSIEEGIFEKGRR
ncbi:hypothetical protein D6817_02225 [Candidatus Pacearchaeota archaeon]|nr:MAG: hypothetical protein D6817_02225 [Candidatus Pacearchaeota archaeon]